MQSQRVIQQLRQGAKDQGGHRQGDAARSKSSIVPKQQALPIAKNIFGFQKYLVDSRPSSSSAGNNDQRLLGGSPGKKVVQFSSNIEEIPTQDLEEVREHFFPILIVSNCRFRLFRPFRLRRTPPTCSGGGRSRRRRRGRRRGRKSGRR